MCVFVFEHQVSDWSRYLTADRLVQVRELILTNRCKNNNNNGKLVVHLQLRLFLLQYNRVHYDLKLNMAWNMDLVMNYLVMNYIDIRYGDGSVLGFQNSAVAVSHFNIKAVAVLNLLTAYCGCGFVQRCAGLSLFNQR